jgi:hypothetical protein
MVLELAVCQTLLLLQSDLDNLEGGNNEQRLRNARCKTCCHAPPVTQVTIMVTKHTLRTH